MKAPPCTYRITEASRVATPGASTHSPRTWPSARRSEDPGTQVVLLEAGGHPPAAELMPVACPVLQLDKETDWMFTAHAGGAGRGLEDGRMMVPRGKMLGGSSGMNYLAYVRGHP